MKATISPRQPDDVRKYRRESHFYREIVALDPRDGSAIVTARIYATNSVAYACIWIHAPDCHTRGGGKAGGYGYHRPSAALADAMCNAGVTLSESISGCGESAMRDAVLATARAATGRRKFFIHEAHA